VPHELAQVLADIILIALIAGLPALFFLFTDRFRRLPSPQEFASLFVMVGLAGVVLRLSALSVLAATILLAIGLAWLSAEYALLGLSYSRTMSPARLFPGEEAELTVRIENRKLLPLAWVRVIDPIETRLVRNDRRLEDVLAFSGGIERDDVRGRSLVTRTAIGPFQAVTRVYRVTGRKRGVYVLGPPAVESGDPFGMFPRRGAIGGKHEIVVYPNVYRPDEIGIPFREMIGELVPPRALVEDPMLVAGSREYRPGDPLRRVHWKATARTGDLQVRVLDPSTTANLLIVLNLNTYQHIWQGVDLERVEATIDAAASLAVWALDRGYATGIRANGTSHGADHVTRIAPSASPRQASIILDHLARLSFSGRFPPEQILLDEMRRLEAGTSLVFVTPTLTAPVIEIVASRRLANRVSLVYTGRLAPASVRGLPVHLMVPPVERSRAVS
jgi:uncharacterized protein (DUF58 family)